MTDETTARIRAEVAGVASEMVESWEGEMTALDKLIEAVEAGTEDFGILEDVDIADPLKREHRKAYHGDLNAALALHEALLPGKCWSVHTSSASVLNGEYDPAPLVACGSMGGKPSPARAWLLAILRAYRSEVKE